MKKHGNTGNKNAKKEVTKDSRIRIRVEQKQKAMWVKRANSLGLTLSAWMTAKCNDKL